MSNQSTAFERHYRIADLCHLWGIGRETLRKILVDEPRRGEDQNGTLRAEIGPVTIPAARRVAVNQNLVEELEAKRGAIKVADLTRILGVDDKHIYRMAARGLLPSFRVGAAVRFDPQEVAKWLRAKYGPEIPYVRKALRSNRPRDTRVRSAA